MDTNYLFDKIKQVKRKSVDELILTYSQFVFVNHFELTITSMKQLEKNDDFYVYEIIANNKQYQFVFHVNFDKTDGFDFSRDMSFTLSKVNNVKTKQTIHTYSDNVSHPTHYNQRTRIYYPNKYNYVPLEDFKNLYIDRDFIKEEMYFYHLEDIFNRHLKTNYPNHRDCFSYFIVNDTVFVTPIENDKKLIVLNKDFCLSNQESYTSLCLYLSFLKDLNQGVIQFNNQNIYDDVVAIADLSAFYKLTISEYFIDEKSLLFESFIIGNYHDFTSMDIELSYDNENNEWDCFISYLGDDNICYSFKDFKECRHFLSKLYQYIND